MIHLYCFRTPNIVTISILFKVVKKIDQNRFRRPKNFMIRSAWKRCAFNHFAVLFPIEWCDKTRIFFLFSEFCSLFRFIIVTMFISSYWNQTFQFESQKKFISFAELDWKALIQLFKWNYILNTLFAFHFHRIFEHHSWKNSKLNFCKQSLLNNNWTVVKKFDSIIFFHHRL